jgi:hypothetical protein
MLNDWYVPRPTPRATFINRQTLAFSLPVCVLAYGSPQLLVEDRRKSQRETVRQNGYVSHMGFSTRCTIVNISPEGAAIEVSDATSIPRTFKLMTAHDRVVRNCRIVWIKLNTLGLEFDAP